jgi:hypothetical protein
MNEPMAPSMVSYFQRRLGMRTPFPAEPDHLANAEYVQSADDGLPGKAQ